MSDPLSIIGNVASLLGFLLTIWVAWRVKVISASYTLQGRAPDLGRSLGTAKRNLDQALDNNLPHLVNDAVAGAKAGLENLQTKASGTLQKATLVALGQATALLIKVPSERSQDECRALSASLAGVIEALKHTAKDFTWMGGR